MEKQKAQNSHMIIKKKNKARGLTLPDFEMCIEIAKSRHCAISKKCMNRSMRQYREHRNTGTQIQSTYLSQRNKGNSMRKSSLFNIQYWKNWISMRKKMKDTDGIPFIKINANVLQF